jgi:serine/threonine-protein phosphatase 6 regulatory subunit 3
MSLLNRNPGMGPTYDEQGRLVGGLKALEALAKVISNGTGDTGSPDARHRDDTEEGSSLGRLASFPLHQSIVSNPSCIDDDSEEIGSDDVSDDISDDHDGMSTTFVVLYSS